MTNHELAKKLLELPNLPLTRDGEYEKFEPKQEEIVDKQHPDYLETYKHPAYSKESYKKWLIQNPTGKYTEFNKQAYQQWYSDMPKCKVIKLN